MFNQRLTALHALTKVLADAMTLPEAAPRVLEAIGGPLGWELGSLWHRVGAEQPLACIGTWRIAELSAASTDVLSSGPIATIADRVATSSQPEWLFELAGDEQLSRPPALAELGARSALAFPIAAGSVAFGAVVLLSREARELDGELLALMASVGNQIGQFVEARVAENVVRITEALNSAIVNSTHDCIIVIDHLGLVLDFNPAAEQILGYSRAEAVGEELASLIIPPSLREHHRQGLERFVRTGTARVLGKRLEVTGMRADGTEFPAELLISRISGSDPPIFAGSLHDVSERRRMEEHRELLLERERTERARAEASQERARGLAVQLLHAEERERGRLSRALHDESVQNLLVALHDLRDVRRGDQDAIGRAEEAVSLTVNQLRDAVFELQPVGGVYDGLHGAIKAMAELRARRGGFAPRVNVAPDAVGPHDQVLFSAARELVTNAARHAAANEVSVTVERLGGDYALDVTDDGRGFDPESLDPASESRHVGLTLLAERVEALGGSFEISSSVGSGTSVQVRLPAFDAAALDAHDARREAEDLLADLMPEPPNPSEPPAQPPRT